MKFSVLYFPVRGESPHIYFTVGYNEWFCYSTETGPEMGHFGHLVRYIYVRISPPRVNRFLICLLICTQREQSLNPCKWRFVSFSRFREIDLDLYDHFDVLVTGTFRVSTCEMLKINDFDCRNRLVELHL